MPARAVNSVSVYYFAGLTITYVAVLKAVVESAIQNFSARLCAQVLWKVPFALSHTADFFALMLVAGLFGFAGFVAKDLGA